MRALIILCLFTATAAAQSPPSKTLERAIKLYDKQDYLSSTVELTKVIDGETGDDKPNQQRAQFFLGKSLYQLGYYVASLATFSKIANDPSNTYHLASLKWLAALTDVVDPDAVPIAAYPIDAADDPMNTKDRDKILYLWGRAKLRHGDTKAATTAFG